MPLDLNSLYSGSIIGQSAGTTKNEDLQLILDVQITHKVLDNFNPDLKETVEEPFTVQVKMNFKDDPTSMRITMEQLEKLGFSADADPASLIPGSPDHYSLIGQLVTVAAKTSSFGGKAGIFWNLRFPKRWTPQLDESKADAVTAKVRETWRKAREQRAEAQAPSEIPF